MGLSGRMEWVLSDRKCEFNRVYRVENVSLMGLSDRMRWVISDRKCEFNGSIGSDGMGSIG